MTPCAQCRISGARALLIPPEKGVSDGAHSPDLAQFQKMMDEIKPYVALWQGREKGKWPPPRVDVMPVFPDDG